LNAENEVEKGKGKEPEDVLATPSKLSGDRRKRRDSGEGLLVGLVPTSAFRGTKKREIGAQKMRDASAASQIISLKVTIDNLQKEREDYVLELNRSRTKVDSIECDVVKKNLTISTLEGELSVVKSEMEERLQVMKREIESVTKERTCLTSQLEQSESNLNQSETKLRTCRDECVKLECEATMLKGQVADLEDKAADDRELRTMLKEKESFIEKLEQDKKMLREQGDAAAERERKESMEKAQAFAKSEESFLARIALLEKERDQMAQKLEDNNRQNGKQVKSLTEQISNLEKVTTDEVNQLNAKLQEQERTHNQNLETIHNLVKHITNDIRERVEIETTPDKEGQEDNREKVTLVSKHQSALKAIDEMMISFEAALDKKDDAINALQDELDGMYEGMEGKLLVDEDKVGRINLELKSTKHKLEQQLKESQGLQQEVERFMEEEAKLKNSVSELEEELQQSRTELIFSQERSQHEQQKCQVLHEQVESMKSKLLLQTESVKALEEEVQVVWSQMKSTEKQMREEHQEEIEQLSVKYKVEKEQGGRNNQERLQFEQQKCQELREQLESMQSELQIQTESVEALEEELRRVKCEMSLEKKKEEKHHLEIEELRTKYDEEREEKEDLITSMERVQRKLKEVEERAVYLEEKVDSSAEAMEELEEEKIILEEELREIKTKLQRNLTEVEHEKDKALQAHEGAEKNVSNLLQMISDLGKEKEKLESFIRSLEHEVSDLKEAKAKLENEHTLELSELKQAKVNIENELTYEIKTVKKELSGVVLRKDELMEERNELAKNNTDLIALVSNQQAILDEVDSRYNSVLGEKEAALREINNGEERKKLESTIKSLELEVSDLKQAKAKLESELLFEVKTLKKELSDAILRRDELVEERQILTKNNTDLITLVSNQQTKLEEAESRYNSALAEKEVALKEVKCIAKEDEGVKASVVENAIAKSMVWWDDVVKDINDVKMNNDKLIELVSGLKSDRSVTEVSKKGRSVDPILWEETISSLEKEKENLEMEHKAREKHLKVDLSNETKKRMDMEKRLREFSKLLMKAENMLKENSKKKQEYEATIKRLETKLNETSEGIEKHKNLVSQSDEGLKLRCAEAELQNALTKLEALRREGAKKEQDYISSLKLLENERSNSMRELSDLRRDLLEKSQDIGELERDIRDKSRQIEETEKVLLEKSRMLAQAEKIMANSSSATMAAVMDALTPKKPTVKNRECLKETSLNIYNTTRKR